MKYQSPPPNQPWPTSKARIGSAGIIAQHNGPGVPKSKIDQICAMMDKLAIKEEKMKAIAGDYKLPELPPKGMRFGPPK
jgi:hypothetical protein